MTIPTYPAELPPPLRADYGEQSGDGRVFFRNDAGVAVPRLRFSATVDTIPYTIRVNRWRLAVFDHFFVETLKNGSLSFTVPAPLVDGYGILDEDALTLLDENDQPLLDAETMLVMFADGGMPSRTSVQADAFRVSFRLLRLPT